MGRAVPDQRPVVLVVEDESLIRMNAMTMVEEVIGLETRQRPYAVLMADDAKERYTHFTQTIAAAKNALDPHAAVPARA